MAKKIKTTFFKKGFMLIELIAVLSIIGLMSVFVINIISSIANTKKLTTTKNRMEVIAKKAREYYLGHGDLPNPSGDSGTVPTSDPNPPPTGNMVPITDSALDMKQLYRLDGWGRYFIYSTFTNDNDSAGNRPDTIFIDPNPSSTTRLIVLNDRTLIRGIQYGDKRAAGILISSGPNQVFEYTGIDPAAPPTNHNDYIKTYTLSSGSDDIVFLIDVTEEAFELTINDLKVLHNKVEAFHAMYEGVDNDSDTPTLVDEDGCRGIDHTVDCPDGVTTGYDPNCGAAVLDTVKSQLFPIFTPCFSPLCAWHFLSTAVTTEQIFIDQARAFIYCLYALNDDVVVDPWLNGYVWGYGDTVASPSLPVTLFNTTDRQYHRFFSAGPDATINNADDITL